jgi:3-hydroxybutyryl-CoA dehydrogenase
MEVDEVGRVLIVGAGTMGQQIGFQCAGHGLDVVLYDVDLGALESARQRIDDYAAGLVGDGTIPAAVRDTARARITSTTNPSEGAAQADLLVEAVPENLKLKRRVLAEFDRLCPPRTVFTTNTSTLLPSQLAKATKRPERVIALHFHLPVWVSNVADVMPHKRTASEVTALVRELARRIGQIPIVLRREHHGYVFNAMYGALNREAITMAERGIASIEDIDRAMVGIDTAWAITDHWARRLFFIRQLRRNADFLKAYVDRGELGVKTGKGFYTYPDPAFARPGFVEQA